MTNKAYRTSFEKRQALGCMFKRHLHKKDSSIRQTDFEGHTHTFLVGFTILKLSTRRTPM